ncbi:hypothetical protein DO64_6013 [Burkholderia pseudomallei]|nr:hypothetical protein DO64_6013 [Burkholderia pseudomallei]
MVNSRCSGWIDAESTACRRHAPCGFLPPRTALPCSSSSDKRRTFENDSPCSRHSASPLSAEHSATAPSTSFTLPHAGKSMP